MTSSSQIGIAHKRQPAPFSADCSQQSSVTSSRSSPQSNSLKKVIPLKKASTLGCFFFAPNGSARLSLKARGNAEKTGKRGLFCPAQRNEVNAAAALAPPAPLAIILFGNTPRRAQLHPSDSLYLNRHSNT